MKALYGALAVMAISLSSLSSLQAQQSVSIGTTTIDPDAVLFLMGNGDQALIIPKTGDLSGMPKKAGMVVYNETDGKVYSCDGTTWSALGGGTQGTTPVLQINGNLVSIFTGQNVNLAATAPTQVGQLFMWDGTKWTATSAPANPLSTGQILAWTGTSWQPQTLPAGGTVTNVTGTAPISVTTGTTTPVISLANTSVTPGNYGNTNVIPQLAIDAQGRVTTATNITIQNANATTTGLLSSTDWTTFNNKGNGTVTNVTGTAPISVATGTTTPTISLANSGVTAGTYGSNVSVPQLTIDALGRITAATNANIPTANTTTTGLLSSTDWNTFNNKLGNGTTATGDLTGTYPAPTISTGVVTSAKIADGTIATADLSSMGAVNAGQVLQWNGTGWAAATLSGTTFGDLTTATTGINIVGGSGAVAGSGVTLNIQNATASQPGLLTATDFTTFTNKMTNPMTTPGDIIYRDATGPQRLATGTGFLKGGATPAYSAVNLASADVTGTLPIANGGTNRTTAGTGGTVLYSDGTALVNTAAGTAGQVLTSNGAGAPTWGAAGLSSTLTNANIFVGNGSNVATGVAVTGDIGITNAGVTSISNTATTGGNIVTAINTSTGSINGARVNPTFGAQNVSTTGTVTAGTTGQFTVDATGNITKINNITTSFPASQGPANSILVNNGSGTLSWVGNFTVLPNQNFFVGPLAGPASTPGTANTGIGYGALSSVTSDYNTAVGRQALASNTNAFNSAVGANALFTNVTGIDNTALGYNAGFNTSGSSNTAIGSSALAGNFGGSNNTALGHSADVSAGGLTNTTVIGAGAVGSQSNSIQLGNSAVTAVRVGVGNTATLITGGLQITGGTPAVGRVLTSDATGNATWQSVAGTGDMQKSTYDTNNDGVLDLAAGGTNRTTAGAAGTILYSDGTALVNSAAGTTGQVLTSNGTGAPTWANGFINPMTTQGDIIYRDAAGAQRLAGAVGILKSNGTTPTWGAINLASIDVTGTLPIANGGTNRTTAGAAGTILYSDGTALINTAAGTTGQVLTSNGTGAPTWANGFINPMTTQGDIIYRDAAGAQRLAAGTGFLRGGATPTYSAVSLASADVSGTLPVANGGTGVATITGVLVGNGTTALTGVTHSAGNQYLRRNSGNTAYEFGDLTLASGDIVDGTIMNIDINGAAAIDGTKINPNFGSQNMVTTGTLNTGTATVSGLTIGATTINWPANSPGVLTNNGTGTLSWVPSSGWGLLGNAGTAPATNFIGTTDAQDFRIRTNNLERLTVTSAGLVGIGSTAPTAALGVLKGTALATASFAGTAHISHFNFSGTEETNIRGGINGAKVFLNDTHNGDVILASGGGNVGVGTVTPGAKLDVIGVSQTALQVTTNAVNPGQYVISAIHTGDGDASGFFWNNNVASGTNAHGVYGQADGGGSGVFGGNGGTTGFAGTFMNFNAGNANPVVQIFNNGTGPSLFVNKPIVIADGGVPAPTTDKLYNSGGNLFWNGVNISSGVGLPAGTTGQTLRHNGTGFISDGNLTNDGTTVSIGNTTVVSDPQNRLRIGDGSAASTYVTLDAGAAFQAGLKFMTSGVENWAITRPQFGDNSLRFTGGGGDRLVLLPNGNIGVGTSAPVTDIQIGNTGHLFDFAGATALSYNLYENGGNLFHTTAGGASVIAPQNDRVGMYVNAAGAVNASFGSTLTNRLVMTTTGVSINKDSPDPSAVLQVVSGTGANARGFMMPSVTTTDRDLIVSPLTGLMVFNQTTNDFNYYNGAAWQTLGGGGSGFNLLNEVPRGDGTSTVSSNIFSNGTNVSIGTSSLSYPLTLEANTAGYMAYYKNLNNGAYSKLVLDGTGTGGGYLSLNSGGPEKGFMYTDGAHTLLGSSGGSAGEVRLFSNGTQRMVVDAGGSVGIGVSAPQGILHVSGGSAQGVLRISNNAIGNTVTDGLEVSIDNSGVSRFRSQENGLMIIGFGSNDVIHVTDGGMVGLNQNNPTATLDVGGNIKISGGTPGVGKVLTSDANGLATWQTPSGGGWGLTGTGSTIDGTNYVGTSDNVPLNFGVNGQKAGRIENNSGTANTFFGFQSGSINTGLNNTGFGYQALTLTTTGYSNTAAGSNALQSNTTGFVNTATGTDALRFNSTGAANAAFGANALRANTAGGNNTGIGSLALYTNSSGGENVAVGTQSMMNNTTGTQNTASGFYALLMNTVGGSNTVAGGYALFSNVSGSNATAIGYGAMERANDTGTPFTNTNVAVGYQSLRGSGTASSNTGLDNTGVGYQSLQSFTTGGGNTALGNSTMWLNTTGSSNTAVGNQALLLNTGGNNNTAVGRSALQSNTGSQNVALGTDAMNGNTGGSFNTGLGYQALLTNSGGSNNTAIGRNADVSTSNLFNATALGANAIVNASNKVRIGDASVTVIEGQVAYTNASDRRFKTDIQEMGLGIDFIKKIRPVTYLMKEGDGRQNWGFIAQDIEALVGTDKAVLTIGQDSLRSLGLRYTDFIAPMVKAMQEQQKMIDEQRVEIEKLKAELKTTAVLKSEPRTSDNATVEAKLNALTAEIEKLKALLGAEAKKDK